jgi:enoyl-CoA hydratase/carnithine racemase
MKRSDVMNSNLEVDKRSGPHATDGPVLAEMQGAVLVLTLNRPEKLNAWGHAMETRYFELLELAEQSPEVRAIVVTGAGRGFCVGADFDDLKAVARSDLTPLGRGRPISYPMTISKPLVAAINGPAAGVGLVQALYCDVRITAPTVKLTTAFARRGLIAEYGCAWLLPGLVGRGAALDLLLSARVVLGDEAFAIGLVNRLAEPDAVLEMGLEYATDLAENCSPTSMSVIKRQVHQAMHQTFDSAFADADVEMLESFSRADAKEGVASYLERRQPAFPSLAP